MPDNLIALPHSGLRVPHTDLHVTDIAAATIADAALLQLCTTRQGLTYAIATVEARPRTTVAGRDRLRAEPARQYPALSGPLRQEKHRRTHT